jgi:hypothetical protein
MGKSHRLSVGTHICGNVGELLGRYLCLLGRPPLESRALGEDSLAASDAETAPVARAIFQTSRRQDCFSRALHPRASVRSSQPLGRHNENTVAAYLGFNLAGSAAYTTVYILLGYFFGKQWKLLQAWLGTEGALHDPGRNHAHGSRFHFPSHAIPIWCTPLFQGATINNMNEYTL